MASRSRFSDRNLTVGDPRCMSCGGELKPTEKQALRDRIPKTCRWFRIIPNIDKAPARGMMGLAVPSWQRINYTAI